MRTTSGLRILTLCASAGLASGAQATQVPLDRTDAGIAARATPATPPPPNTPLPATVAIESPRAATPVSEGGIVAGAIRVVGAPDIAPDLFMPVVSPYIGHHLSRGDLQDLLEAVSGVARARGYVFAHSAIPEQRLIAGVLRIRLDEGRIDTIRLTGGRNRAVLAILSELEGHAPTRAELERRILLAGDLPGVRIGKVSYAREGERGVLIVPLTLDRVDGRATLDNRGNTALGPVRATLAVDMNGLLDDRDILTVQGLVTPIQPRELQVFFARYDYTLDDAGTELAVYGSYGRTRSGGAWRAYDTNGMSGIEGVSLTRPLVRGRKRSLWLTGEVDHFAIDQWSSGRLIQRDRLTTASVSVNGFVPLAGGRLRAGLGLTEGLGGIAAGDPLASRIDAGAAFTMVSGWANWEGTLHGPFSARLAMAAQASTQPLLAIEQIAIGGPVFGRGYDYSERSGDEGVLGSAELRARLLDRSSGALRWAQLYTFVDGGSVSNIGTSYGAGTLYSAGGGARVTIGKHTRLELEAAFPINAIRYDSGDQSPRISASFGTSF